MNVPHAVQSSGRPGQIRRHGPLTHLQLEKYRGSGAGAVTQDDRDLVLANDSFTRACLDSAFFHQAMLN
jgi:hypothetical protein